MERKIRSYVNLNPGTKLRFIEYISNRLPHSWRRDLVQETAISHYVGETVFCFVSASNYGLDAKIYLASSSENQLYVSGVTSNSGQKLHTCAYNQVIIEFNKTVIANAVKSFGGTVIVDSAIASIEDFIGFELSNLFETFISKVDGRLGKMDAYTDKKEWYNFILRSHLAKRALSFDEIKQILIFKKCPITTADNWAYEYELLMGMLQFRDKAEKATRVMREA